MMGRIPTLNECKPGLVRTLEFNVLVAPEEIEERTKGGIILPENAKEVQQIAAVRGRIIQYSRFSGSAIWPDDEERPKPGDVVYYAKYAGTILLGADGREYRAMKDKDLIAIIEEPTHG